MISQELRPWAAAMLFLVLASGGWAAGASEKLTPVQAHGKLSVKNLRLTDEHGVPVQLRGFSSNNIKGFDWLFTADFLKELVDAKVDILRIALYTDPTRGIGYLERDGAPDLKLRDVVEEIVRLTKAAGLYCIVDWHIHRDGNPMAIVKQAIDFFDYFSKKYGSEPHVLFEIANEPNGPGVTWDDVIKPYAEQVLSVIRKNAPDAIVIVGTPNYDLEPQDAAANPLAPDDHLLYTIHFYAASAGDDQRAKVAAAARTIPLFCTEWGTTNSDVNGPPDVASTRAWHDLMDRYGISSCNWSLSTFRESGSALGADFFPGETKFLDGLTESGKLALQMIQRPKK